MPWTQRSRAGLAAVAIAGMAFAGADPIATAQEEPLPGKIAFASDADGDYEIFVMRADGSNPRQLTHNEADDFGPSWSPDGDRLVYEREREDTGYEDIYILHVATGRSRPWIRSRHLDEGDVEWSPDGKWIAFRGNDHGDGSDVVATRVNRKEGRLVATQQENSSNSDPTWSSDGSEVAFVESYEGAGIYVARFCCSRGYKSQEVTYGVGWKSALDWSPDDTCIVYARETYSEGPGNGRSIFTVPSDGGEPKLIRSGQDFALPGSWSPDGSEILFYSDEASSYDLYLMDADGSDVRPITDSEVTNEVTPAWWAPVVADPVTPECGGPEPTPTPSVPPLDPPPAA